MNNYTLGELSTAVVIMMGAAGGLLLTCMKSRCDSISCCWGGCIIHRTIPGAVDPDGDVEDPPIENALPPGTR